jgi:hypothetical protein
MIAERKRPKSEPEEGVNMGKTEESASSTSAKAAGGIFVVAAFVATLISLSQPMSQRIDFLEHTIQKLEAKMDADDVREQHDQGNFASLQEKFSSVETEFIGLREVMMIQMSELQRRVQTVETWQPKHDLRVRGLNSAQWERIKALERDVYKPYYHSNPSSLSGENED